MAIETHKITDEQRDEILNKKEDHFFDGKRKEIQPTKLTNTVSAFANADGGELFIGLAEDSAGPLLPFRWEGFADPENANNHIAIFDDLFPLGHDYRYSFLINDRLATLCRNRSTYREC